MIALGVAYTLCGMRKKKVGDWQAELSDGLDVGRFSHVGQVHSGSDQSIYNAQGYNETANPVGTSAVDIGANGEAQGAAFVAEKDTDSEVSTVRWTDDDI